MVRFFYTCLLRLHPRHFRQRFAEEMVWIFDQAAGTRRAGPLLVDAFISLVRQWALRAGFVKEYLAIEPAQAASDGVPLFYTFDSFKPRTAALINGTVVSVIAFCAVIFVFNYSLSEPLRPLAGAPSGSSSPTLTSSGEAASAASGEQPSSVNSAGEDSGVWTRLRSLFGASKSFPSHSRPARPGTNVERQPGPDVPAQNMKAADGAAKADASLQPQNAANHRPVPLPDARLFRGTPGVHLLGRNGVPYLPIKVPEQVLRRYVGTYFAESPNDPRISITLEGGQLNIDVAGQPKSALVPVSQTRFFLASATDRWVEFAKNKDGRVNQLDIYQNDRHITAHRTSR